MDAEEAKRITENIFKIIESKKIENKKNDRILSIQINNL